MTKASLATLVVVAVASPALAERQPVVDVTVTSVVYDPGTHTRAIAGDDAGAFLAIERLARGRITDHTRITELPIGRARVPLTEFKNLRVTSLAGTSLVFELAPRMHGARRAIQCTAALALDRGRVQVRSTSCTQDDGPHAVLPPPPATSPSQVTTAELKAASKACDAAFAYSSERKHCLDMTIDALAKSKFRRSVINTVSACASAFAYSSSRKWCIETASRSTREPVELIGFCKEQHAYESEQKACLSKYTQLR